MLVAQIVLHGDAGDLLYEIVCAIFGCDQITDHSGHGSGMRVGSDDGDLRTRPVQNPFANWMTLRSIGIEQIIRSPSLDGSCELPSKVHRISQTCIHTLSTERRMYMGCISRKKYSPSAIRRRLTRSVGVAGGDLHRLELYFCSGDMLQHSLKIFESDFRGAIESAPIEIDDPDATRSWP